MARHLRIVPSPMPDFVIDRYHDPCHARRMQSLRIAIGCFVTVGVIIALWVWL